MRFHQEPPIVCDACGKTYLNSRYLYLHQRYAPYKTAFLCHLCKRFMATQVNLDQHIRQQHGQKERVICDECGKSFSTNDTLRRHVKFVHFKVRSFSCEICNKFFSRKCELRQHLLIRTGKRLFMCDICGQQFTQKSGLVSHRKRHPGEHPRLPTVRLDYALSEFTKKKFSRGEPNRDPPPLSILEKFLTRPLGNTVAQARKNRKSNLAKSSTNVHQASTTTFSIVSTLVQTSKVIPNFVLANINPNESPKIIMSNTTKQVEESDPLLLKTLEQPINSRISIKAEPLSIIGSSKSSENEIRTHIKSEKSNRLSVENMGVLISSMYKCKGCGKLFKRKEMLRAHYIRLHTDIYQFPCEECGEKFKFFYYLSQHKRLCHPKEKSAETSSSGITSNTDTPTQKKIKLSYKDFDASDRVCKICNKEFPSPSALRNHHIRMHTKEFKYPCDMCPKKFKLCKDFNDHRRRVHPNQLSRETNNPKKKVPEPDPLSINHLEEPVHAENSIKVEPLNIIQSSESSQNEMKTQMKNEKSDRLSIENMGVEISTMYKCKGCGKFFKRKDILKAHYIRLHTDIYRFPCEKCGEKFKFFYHLNQHKRLCHPEENPAETSSSGKTSSKELTTEKKKRLRLKTFDPSDRICKICNKEFPNPSSRKYHHIRMHTKDFIYPCGICPKQFKLRKDFSDHRRRVHPKETLTETQENWIKRVQESREITKDVVLIKEDSIEIVEHSVATEDENSVEALPSQKKETQRGEKLFQDLTCHICDKKFQRLHALKNHNVRFHTEGFEHTCELCFKQFKILKDLQKHIKLFHLNESSRDTQPNSEKGKRKIKEEQEFTETGAETSSSSKVEKVPKKRELFICEACGREFVRKASLQMHFNRTHTQECNYTCAECGKEFRIKKDLCAHLRRIHQQGTGGREKTGEFVCNICGIKVLRKGTLTIHHLRKHTHQFKFSCKVCGKNFKVQGDLTTHTRLRHLEPPAICEVCGKTCKNKHSLYVHQKYSHFQTKFRCPYCTRCYASQKNLDHHLMSHENKERLTCSECSNTFASKTTLVNHIRCVHAQEKAFSCQVCGKLFPSYSRLRKHLITHSGKRLCICEICGKQFKQKPSLISHRKKKHPGEHPPLPIIRLDNVLSEFIQK